MRFYKLSISTGSRHVGQYRATVEAYLHWVCTGATSGKERHAIVAEGCYTLLEKLRHRNILQSLCKWI